MKRTIKILVAALTFGISASAVNAATVGLNIYNSTKAGATNTAAAAVNVRVWDTGSGEYKFSFFNDSAILSSITKLYFDNSLSSVLGSVTEVNASLGVNFVQGSDPAPPFSGDIGWTGSLLMGRADGTTDAEKIANGIANGGTETLVVKFAKVGGTALQDVLDLLTSTGGIAVHLADLEGNGLTTNVDMTSMALVGPGGSEDGGTGGTPVIPTPASAAAGMALMGVLASRRRQKA